MMRGRNLTRDTSNDLSFIYDQFEEDCFFFLSSIFNINHVLEYLYALCGAHCYILKLGYSVAPIKQFIFLEVNVFLSFEFGVGHWSKFYLSMLNFFFVLRLLK